MLFSSNSHGVEMYKVTIQNRTREAFDYCLRSFGPIGVVVPCHDPLVYKIARFITWIWREPDRPHDFYVKEGRWGNSLLNHEFSRNLSARKKSPSTIFYFNNSRDATMFKLAWGGNL